MGRVERLPLRSGVDRSCRSIGVRCAVLCRSNRRAGERRRGIIVSFGAVWNFVHRERLSRKKPWSRPCRTGLMLHAGGHDGSNIDPARLIRFAIADAPRLAQAAIFWRQ